MTVDLRNSCPVESITLLIRGSPRTLCCCPSSRLRLTLVDCCTVVSPNHYNSVTLDRTSRLRSEDTRLFPHEARPDPSGVAEIGLEEGLAATAVSAGGEKAELVEGKVKAAVVLGKADG